MRFHRKVHVTRLSYRGTGCAGDRKQRPHAPEPAPLTREARRSAGERWCYSLKVRAWAVTAVLPWPVTLCPVIYELHRR